jgi:hypothetical protein
MGLAHRKAPSARHVLDLPPPYQGLLEVVELIFLLAGEKLAEYPEDEEPLRPGESGIVR